MLLGILGILGGGKDGPYSYGYFLDDLINSNYSNNTPQQSLDWSGYYFTYTLGQALTADGGYSNYYFLEGQINTSYTNLHTALTAIDYPNQEYLYRDGIAVLAPLHTTKVNLSSLSTSYWLSANPEGFLYPISIDFYNGAPVRYKIYTKSNNLEEAPNYPVEPMQGPGDLIEDDEISGELYPGQYPEDFSNKVALWAIREGYFFFAINPFVQYVIHRLEKEGDNFTTKFYSNSQNIGQNPLHTSSANNSPLASNLRGQNYYSLGSPTLWHTDNDGYFTGGYTHSNTFERSGYTLWYDSQNYYNGEVLYIGSNVWTVASFLSGYTQDTNYYAGNGFWNKEAFWSTNESGVYGEGSPNAPYVPAGAGGGIYFQTDIDVIGGTLTAPAWKYPTGSDTPGIASNTSLWLLTGVYQYYNSTTGIDTIFEYNVETNPIPGAGYGQTVTFLKLPYSIAFDYSGSSYTYWFNGQSGSIVSTERYRHTDNGFVYLLSPLERQSDINGDGLIEEWSIHPTTRVISWTNQYVPFDGYTECNGGSSIQALLNAQDGNTLTVGKTIYYYDGTQIVPYVLTAWGGRFAKDGYYYDTNTAGTITTITECGY
jgi:hypothetical protein